MSASSENYTIHTVAVTTDKLRFILLGSQCLRAFDRGFPLFFFWLFLLQKAETC